MNEQARLQPAHATAIRYGIGSRRSRNPTFLPAMLLEGQEECEIDKVLSHRSRPHKRQPTHREYLVSWKGMRPEDREWLSEHKLKNAADLVQEYLQGLQASGRSAPRIGKASIDVPAGDNVPRQSGEAQTKRQQKQRKTPGRPAKQQTQQSSESVSAVDVPTRRSARLHSKH